MIFRETKLKGAYSIEPERREDERGFFARTFALVRAWEGGPAALPRPSFED